METSKLRVNDRIFPLQAYHMYVTSYERWSDGVFQSLSTWISSLLVSKQHSSGDDVCIQLTRSGLVAVHVLEEIWASCTADVCQ